MSLPGGSFRQADRRFLTRGLWASAATAAVTLAYYMNTAQFSRYVSGDYCYATNLQTLGWLGTQGSYYSGLVGRWASTAVATSVEVIGQAALPSFAGLMLIGLVAAIAVAVREVLRVGLAASVATGVVTTFVLVASAPQKFQTIFWLSGTSNYRPPVILWAVAVAIAARTHRDPRRRWLVALVAIGIVAAGFSETSTAVAIASGFLLLGLGAFRSSVALRRPAAAFLVGSLLGFAIVLAAPGNGGRVALLPAADLPAAITSTPGFLLTFVDQFLSANGAIEVFVVALAFLVGWARLLPTIRGRWLLVGSAAAAMLLYVAVFPAIWLTSQDPPDRALIYPGAILLAWLGLVGWVAGSAVARARRPLAIAAAGAAAIALAIVPMIAFGDLRAARPELERWAVRQDELHAMLAAHPSGTTVVAWQLVEPRGLLRVGLRQPGADPAFWINDCVARLHGLDALIVTP